MVPTATTLPSYSRLTHMASWGALIVSWQRKKRPRPTLQMVLRNMQAPPESGQLPHYSPFLGKSWRMVVKGNVSSGRTSSSAPGHSHCLEREMATYVIIYWSLCCVQRFGWMFGDLDATWLKNWWWQNLWKTRLLCRLFNVDRLFRMGIKHEDIFSHVHAHRTVTIDKEDFHNKVDRMTCFVNHRQHLSSAPPVTAQWIH